MEKKTQLNNKETADRLRHLKNNATSADEIWHSQLYAFYKGAHNIVLMHESKGIITTFDPGLLINDGEFCNCCRYSIEACGRIGRTKG